MKNKSNYLSIDCDNYEFYDFQIQAIKTITAYLRDYFSKKINGSSLVCIPTGCGKTAIFTYVAGAFKNIERPGVLT